MFLRKYGWVIAVLALIVVLMGVINLSGDPSISGEGMKTKTSNIEGVEGIVEPSTEKKDAKQKEVISHADVVIQSDSGQHQVNAPHLSGEDDNIKSDANEFFGAVFPGMTQGSGASNAYEGYSEAKAGDVIQVEDFFKKGPSTKIIPHMSNGRVIALSVYRKFDGKTYRPAREIDMSEQGWEDFPPISRMEAESLLVEKMPNSYMPISGFVHIDNVTPNYQFVVPGEEKLIYLVSAFDGSVFMIPADFTMPEEKEQELPVYLSDEGLLVIDSEKAASWSAESLAKLQADTNESNAEIRAGLLKIGPNLEVIFDKRPHVNVITPLQ